MASKKCNLGFGSFLSRKIPIRVQVELESECKSGITLN